MYGVFIRLTQTDYDTVKQDPPSALRLRESSDPADSTDVDKAWHAIHFVLCGDEFNGEMPSGFIFGSPSLKGVDFGMGPPSLNSVTEVAEIADYLESVDLTEFRERWNRAEFGRHDIYVVAEPDETDWEYVSSYYSDLREFVLRLRDEAAAMLHYVS